MLGREAYASMSKPRLGVILVAGMLVLTSLRALARMMEGGPSLVGISLASLCIVTSAMLMAAHPWALAAYSVSAVLAFVALGFAAILEDEPLAATALFLGLTGVAWGAIGLYLRSAIARARPNRPLQQTRGLGETSNGRREF